MEEKNELNDIILNRGNNNSNIKKVMLAIASLAVLLIIVVVIMSSLNSDETSNLPQPIKPPRVSEAPTIEEDPLFEPISIDESLGEQETLDDIAKKIKKQSEESELMTAPDDIINDTLDEEIAEIVVPAKYERAVKKTPKKVVEKPVVKTVAKKATPAKGRYYIQVGSFSHYAPDKSFLKKIKNGGYTYKLHKVMIKGKSITKVLVGPFETNKQARKELKKVRSSIVSGAFLYRI